MKTIYLLVSFGLRLGVGLENLDSKGFFVWYKTKTNFLLSEDNRDENSKILRFKEDIMKSVWRHMKYLELVNENYTYRILGIEIPDEDFISPVRGYYRNGNLGGEFPHLLKVRSVSIDNKVISDMVESIKKTGKITRDLRGFIFIENNYGSIRKER